jgi:hypothetical protein
MMQRNPHRAQFLLLQIARLGSEHRVDQLWQWGAPGLGIFEAKKWCRGALNAVISEFNRGSWQNQNCYIKPIS